VAQALSRLVGTDVPVLGEVPIDLRLREAGDEGTPLVLAEPAAPAAKELAAIADKIARRSRSLVGRQLSVTPV
jgi:ATP-binding protein involved in chromosome partitioning